MNLERGFRRLVLTVSFAAASAGLVVTGYDTYKTVQYVSGNKNLVECVKATESWTPTVEDFKLLPDEWRPRAAPKLDDVERLKRWTEAARGYRVGNCGHFLDGIAIPAHLDRPWELTNKLLWYTTGWFPPWHSASYTLALLPLILGVLVSTGLGLMPWGVFYLVCWVVRGFRE
jgi:hypothetical protein